MKLSSAPVVGAVAAACVLMYLAPTLSPALIVILILGPVMALK